MAKTEANLPYSSKSGFFLTFLDDRHILNLLTYSFINRQQNAVADMTTITKWLLPTTTETTTQNENMASDYYRDRASPAMSVSNGDVAV